MILNSDLEGGGGCPGEEESIQGKVEEVVGGRVEEVVRWRKAVIRGRVEDAVLGGGRRFQTNSFGGSTNSFESFSQIFVDFFANVIMGDKDTVEGYCRRNVPDSTAPSPFSPNTPPIGMQVIAEDVLTSISVSRNKL